MNLIYPSWPFAFLFLSSCAVVSEVAHDPRAVSFRQACKDATTDALVINLAAHPDDEAARTLVYLRRHGVRTVTVYSTCGDGGQNAIGREIGPALAFLRTRETLAAARFTGTQVRWLGFPDFGYSKTAEETLRVWGKEKFMRALDEVVTAAHPDVAFTNHSPDRGHGHHRASVQALRELAEDKARRGWVIPVYQRGTGGSEGWQVKFRVGGVDPVAGQSYARQAYRGWRQHRTQGVFGPFTGTRLLEDKWGIVHPKGVDGAALLSFLGSMFEEAAFVKLAAREGVDAEALRAQFDAFGDLDDRVGNIERARQLLPEMERLRGALSGGPARLRLDRRIDALQRIVMLGAGISVTAQLSHDRLGTGSRGILYLRVNREGSTAPRRVRAELMGRGAEGRDGQVRLAFGPLANVPAGDVKPGWFRPTISFDVDGVSVTRQIPVQYTPVQRVALRWQRDVRMVPSSRSGGQIEVPIEIAWNGDQAVDASLEFEPADGVAAEVAEASIRLFAGGRKREEIVSVRLPDRPLNHDAKIYAVASVAGSRSKGGDQDPVAVGTSSLLVRPVDANLPEGLEVGLIRGPDDSLQLALQDLGIKYALLADDKPLGELNLSSMSTIVLDIRAYHHRRDYLRDNRDAILGYCKSGGRVVSFYHKPLEWNPTQVRPLLSPFELSVGRGRVCEEDAKVTFLESEHRLLNYPNKVGQEDFKGWVQERGLNFPNKWSSRWTPILRMNDTGERPLDGALLYAEYGEGDYVYCSLALYRQLRRGHAGAARILVNLLSK